MKTRTDRLYDTFKKSKQTGIRIADHVAKGLCARCWVKPHSDGPGSTSWYCAECAEKNRERQRTNARLRNGKPLSDPLDKRGRKRATHPRPPEPPEKVATEKGG